MLIFTSTDPHFHWDGKVNGKIDVNETYSWKITLKTKFGHKENMSGIITVL